MSVVVKYKGNTIASASTEVTKTLKTSGKYCEADILVENTPDGGDAPVINPLSITANGTYTAPSGVDGYSPVTVNVPQGITPSGNINITDTNPTDVTNYATAQVVDADLVASNIKKDVNILGVVGSFEGGGGGSLPSVISKIDGGSFTLSADTNAQSYSVSHNLGESPKGFFVWSDLGYGESESSIMLSSIAWGLNNYSATVTSYYGMARKLANGSMGTAAGGTVASTWVTSTTLKVNQSIILKAGITYKWLAWA